MKAIIIGGVAGGATAAARLRFHLRYMQRLPALRRAYDTRLDGLLREDICQGWKQLLRHLVHDPIRSARPPDYHFDLVDW